MTVCAYCGNRYKKGSGITFHKFPVEAKAKQQWVENMKLKNWFPREKEYLCSEHFTPECFIKHDTRTTLNYGSVPTIFIDDEEETAPEVDETDDLSSSSHDGVNLNETSRAPPKEDRPKIVLPLIVQQRNVEHDHHYTVTPNNTKIALKRVKKSLETTRSNARVLERNVKKLKSMVSSLKIIVSHYKKKEEKGDSWKPKIDEYLTEKDFTDDCVIKHVINSTLESDTASTVFLVKNSEQRKASKSPRKRVKESNNESQDSFNEAETSTPIIKSKKKTKEPEINEDNTETSKTIEMDDNDTSNLNKNKMQRLKKSLKISRSHVKALKQQVDRLNTTVTSLKSTIARYKNKKLNYEDCVNLLNQYQNVRPELSKRIVKNKYKNSSGFTINMES